MLAGLCLFLAIVKDVLDMDETRTRYRVRSLGDFQTVQGKVKPLYGCSFADIGEFLERIEYIKLAIQNAEDDNASLETLLMSDSMLKHSVEQCLAMHGLSLADVSLRHVVELLLVEVVDGELKPGLLVRINSPRTKQELDSDFAEQMGIDLTTLNYERALAVIASHTQSVSEAVELTHAMTVQQLSDLVDEKAKIAKALNSTGNGVGASPDNKQLELIDLAMQDLASHRAADSKTGELEIESLEALL